MLNELFVPSHARWLRRLGCSQLTQTRDGLEEIQFVLTESTQIDVPITLFTRYESGLSQ